MFTHKGLDNRQRVCDTVAQLEVTDMTDTDIYIAHSQAIRLLRWIRFWALVKEQPALARRLADAILHLRA